MEDGPESGIDPKPSCVTAQINGWKFPSIDEGVVSFKTPFVFTPPQ